MDQGASTFMLSKWEGGGEVKIILCCSFFINFEHPDHKANFFV